MDGERWSFQMGEDTFAPNAWFASSIDRGIITSVIVGSEAAVWEFYDTQDKINAQMNAEAEFKRLYKASPERALAALSGA